MENLNTPSELRVAALMNSPAFLAIYSQSPDSLNFKGKTYYRDAALSVEERLWYLSALALKNPKQLYQLANTPMGPYSLDADDSEVVAAQAAVRACNQKMAMLKAKRENQVRLIDLAQNQLNAQGNAENVLAGIFTAGISSAVQVAEFTTALSQRKGALVQIDMDIVTARAECVAAAQNLTDAQKRLDDANKKIRAEEEKARQQKLTEDLAAAKARQDEAEQREIQNRADAAAKAAAARAAQAASDAAARAAASTDDGSGAPPDDWNPSDYPELGSQDDGGDDFGSGNPDDSYWADAIESGIYGDDEQSREQLIAQGEIEPRYTDSPYYFDRYYACDACQRGEDFDAGAAQYLYDGDNDSDDGFGCDDGTCPTCNGYGLEGYGAEGEGVMAIFAGLLAAAPSVINAFAGPSGGANGNFTQETTDKILKDTGVQAKIDAAAKAEGDKARNTILLVGGGLAILAVKLLS